MTTIAAELVDMLACPQCHAKLALDYEGAELSCTSADCGLAYPIREGIPVMLVDEARRPR
ncbi:MAG: Trm112 family protein [Propionibacteriaceae bacterium]